MSERAVSIGGLAGVLAGGLFIVTAILDTVAPVDAIYDSLTEYVYLIAGLLAFLGVVVAVAGVSALKSRTDQLRRVGAVAAWLVGIGYGAMALLNVINLVMGERSLVMVRLGFALVMLLGSIILGVVILRTHLLPWWCGVLMIIAFPLGHFANGVFPSAENALYVLLWGSVGFALLSRAEVPADQVAAQPVRVG